MYELHPLCTLFPRVEGESFDALVSDIRANGLREPITLHDGMILDGGNRYRACLAAGVEPTFVAFTGGNIVSFVLSANLHRRHLSPGQQAAIVASAQDWAKARQAGGDGSNQHGAKVQDCTIATVAQRAAQSGVSTRTQKMADKVAKVDPELAKEVAHGNVSLPAAVEKITGKRPGAKPKPANTNKPDVSVSADVTEDAEPEHTEADETAIVMRELAEEVETLRAKVVAREEGADVVIDDLRDQIRKLEAENETLRISRDGFQTKCSEMLKQCKFWEREARKLGYGK